MLKQYTREELWKLYKKLPQELKEAIFSEETAEQIGNVCKRYKISDEKISKVAKHVGNVLLGILSPDEFQNTLVKEVKLKKDVAKKVAHEINRFIFYPVKPALEELYKMEITKSAEAIEKVKPKEERLEKELEEEKPKVSPRKDVYREPIE